MSAGNLASFLLSRKKRKLQLFASFSDDPSENGPMCFATTEFSRISHFSFRIPKETVMIERELVVLCSKFSFGPFAANDPSFQQDASSNFHSP